MEPVKGKLISIPHAICNAICSVLPYLGLAPLLRKGFSRKRSIFSHGIWYKLRHGNNSDKMAPAQMRPGQTKRNADRDDVMTSCFDGNAFSYLPCLPYIVHHCERTSVPVVS